MRPSSSRIAQHDHKNRMQKSRKGWPIYDKSDPKAFQQGLIHRVFFNTFDSFVCLG